MPGAYIPVPGCSAGILKGFPTFIRGAEGISHQRGSSLGYILLNLRSGENPDPSRNWDMEPGGIPGRHSQVFRMVTAYVAALPAHCRPAVMSFSSRYVIFSCNFDENMSKTTQNAQMRG